MLEDNILFQIFAYILVGGFLLILVGGFIALILEQCFSGKSDDNEINIKINIRSSKATD